MVWTIITLVVITFIPAFELRASIPYGFYDSALAPAATVFVCVMANIALAPVVWLFLDKGIHIFLRVQWIQSLYDRYRGIPSLQDLNSSDPRAWYTHFPNDPTAIGPDRTIDYLFYSDQWALEDAYVLRGDALQISDHLPVVGTYRLPSAAP